MQQLHPARVRLLVDEATWLRACEKLARDYAADELRRGVLVAPVRSLIRPGTDKRPSKLQAHERKLAELTEAHAREKAAGAAEGAEAKRKLAEATRALEEAKRTMGALEGEQARATRARPARSNTAEGCRARL